jgi:hypothetical protein
MLRPFYFYNGILCIYFIKNCGEKNKDMDYMASKKLPPKKYFDRDVTRIRDIDVNAPLINGKSNTFIRTLVRSKWVTDSAQHNSQSIK